jgi:hypothetical protein
MIKWAWLLWLIVIIDPYKWIIYDENIVYEIHDYENNRECLIYYDMDDNLVTWCYYVDYDREE